MKSAVPPPEVFRPVPGPQARAFSLVVTLIIVSMLAVVAIGFLSSMSNERATADAFGNKSRAEQAAQAGVDSASAILREAFKDFPDSATVWENQSKNADYADGTAPVAGQPTGLYNEGTSLYVHAMPSQINTNQPDPTATVDDNSPSHVVSATDGSDARATFVLPLVSGASYRPIGAKDQAVNGGIPFDGKSSDKATRDKFVDLNVLRYKDDTQGWIGSPPQASPSPTPGATPPPKTVRVPWVEIKQPDVQDQSKAPVVARYAFWVEDESFRANINYAGLGTASATPAPAVPPDPSTRRADNNATFATSTQPVPYATPTPTPDLPLNASNVDLNGVIQSLTTFTGNPAGAEPYAKALFDLRSIYPGGVFPEFNAYSHMEIPVESSTAHLPYNLADQLRFLVTTTSAGLNLSRHGTQRVSLNNLVYPNKQPYRDVSHTAQPVVDGIVKTIQYHAPNFGQRFYRNIPAWTSAYQSVVLNDLTVKGDPDPKSPLHDHKLIYLNKLAANITDYIDDDSQPTFIDQNGNVVQGAFQGYEGFNSVNNASPIWANGKENLPYMDECGARFRLVPIAPDGSKPQYHLVVDYYIEVWNMSGRDITPADLGSDARIRISQPPPWTGNSSSTASSQTDTYLPCKTGASPSSSREFPDLNNDTTPKRDFDIDISQVTFRAGRSTIITTDLDWKDIITNWREFNNPVTSQDDPPNVYLCSFLSPGERDYIGEIPYLKGSNSTRCKVIHIPPGPTFSNTSSSDYKTSVVIYSPTNGYFDLLEGAIPMASSGAFSMTFPAATATTNVTTAYKLYGGSLRGNTGATPYTPSTTGDPRTNNEQMDYVLYLSGGPADQSRYFNFTYSGNSGGGGDSSLGFPNYNFTKPNENTTTGVTPWPDFITFSQVKNVANSPAVYANAPLTSIGQLGDVYDPARWVGGLSTTTLNAARGGGRTLKIGQHDDRWDGNPMSASHSWASWRLADFFCTDDAMLQPGLININGVARDNGAALRAALLGFKFQQNAPNGRGASLLESAGALNTAGLNAVISQIKQRVALPPASDGTWGTPGYEPLNTGCGPFFERGELSELPAFGRNPTSSSPPTGHPATELANGVDLGQVDDRGREEFFRRLVEMTTTRGDVFTVYAIGQAITQTDPTDPKTKRVMSTQRLKVTFRLVPKKRQETDNRSTYSAQDFYPAKESYATTYTADGRFKRPDHYDIQILSSSKGGG